MKHVIWLIGLFILLTGCSLFEKPVVTEKKIDTPAPVASTPTPLPSPSPAPNLVFGEISKNASDKLAFCDRYTGDRYKNFCIRNLAKTLGEAAVCLKISSSDDRASCINVVAWTTKNESICSLISDITLKNACQKGFY